MSDVITMLPGASSWVSVRTSSMATIPVGSFVYMNVDLQGDLWLQRGSGETITFANKDDWSSVQTISTRWEKRTPTWAIVMGILGLLFFLIGALLFFYKEQYPVIEKNIQVNLPNNQYIAGVIQEF